MKLVSKEFKEIEIPVEEILEGDLMIIRPVKGYLPTA